MVEEVEGKKKNRPSKIKKILAVIVAVVVLAGIGSAFWYQQQTIAGYASENNDLEKSLKTVKSDLAKTTNTVKSLYTKVNDLDSQLDAYNNYVIPESATLTLEVGKAAHNGASYNESGTDLLYVDLTVTNNSDVVGYFSTYDLKLKDDKNRVHPLCQDSAIGYYVCQTGLELPKGSVELTSQELGAGDTVTGTVGFYVPFDESNFTLQYVGQNFTISAPQKANAG